MKTVISSPTAPSAIGPYSQAILVNGVLFVSGQLPIVESTGEILEGTIAEQTELVLRYIGEILKEKSLHYENVVKTTVFLTDLQNFETVNKVYARFFREEAPARSCVQVAALPKGAAIEIEVIAAR